LPNAEDEPFEGVVVVAVSWQPASKTATTATHQTA
jgi:hypothetical protein